MIHIDRTTRTQLGAYLLLVAACTVLAPTGSAQPEVCLPETTDGRECLWYDLDAPEEPVRLERECQLPRSCYVSPGIGDTGSVDFGFRQDYDY